MDVVWLDFWTLLTPRPKWLIIQLLLCQPGVALDTRPGQSSNLLLWNYHETFQFCCCHNWTGSVQELMDKLNRSSENPVLAGVAQPLQQWGTGLGAAEARNMSLMCLFENRGRANSPTHTAQETFLCIGMWQDVSPRGHIRKLAKETNQKVGGGYQMWSGPLQRIVFSEGFYPALLITNAFEHLSWMH